MAIETSDICNTGAPLDDPTLLAAIIEAAREYVIVSMNDDGAILSWNAGAEHITGWRAEEVLGRDAELLFTPEDRALGIPAKERETARTRGRAEDERWHQRRNGSRFWGSGLLLPLHNAGVDGFVKVMRDRTEELHRQHALERSERRLRTLIEHIPQLVWRSERLGEWSWVSPQWTAFTGFSADPSAGLGWLDAIHPEDRSETMEAWQTAERTGEFSVEHRIFRQSDGAWRWMQSRASRLTDDEGLTLEWFGTSTDQHEMRRMQERQQLLLRELHHRSRNLLAIVSAIARRTAGLSVSVADFTERFLRRIAALGRVQGLVSQTDRGELELEELIRAEFAVHGHDAEQRVTIGGPQVRLKERAGETVAIALHELATNAAKYGALASTEGAISVTWRVRPDRWLLIEWRETGVALANLAPPRRGYGRELLEEGLPRALGAQTRFELLPDGVSCVIELPDHERDRGS